VTRTAVQETTQRVRNSVRPPAAGRVRPHADLPALQHGPADCRKLRSTGGSAWGAADSLAATGQRAGHLRPHGAAERPTGVSPDQGVGRGRLRLL